MKREALEFLERVMNHLRLQMDAKDNRAHEDYRAWSLVMDLKNVHLHSKWARESAKRAKELRRKELERMQGVLETVARYSERHNAAKWESVA